MPSLSHLPQDLLLVIANNLKLRDTNSLARTNRQLHRILNRYLYHRSTKARGRKSAVLWWACENMQPGTARHALQAGADINALDMTCSPWCAPLSRALEWIMPRWKAHSERVSSTQGAERAMAEVGVRWTVLLSVLLAHNPNVNARGADGLRPLHKAVPVPKGVNIVKGLVSRGATVHDPGDIITPLHVAASEGKVELIGVFMTKGARINARTKTTGATPLHEAARRGELAAMKLLIELGAEVDAGDLTDSTPLSYALKYATDSPKRPIIECLTGHGADIMAVSRSALQRVILAEYYPEAVECWTGCGSDVAVGDGSVLVDLEHWCERSHTIKCVLLK